MSVLAGGAGCFTTLPPSPLSPVLEVFQSVSRSRALLNQWTFGVDPKYPLGALESSALSPISQFTTILTSSNKGEYKGKLEILKKH